MKLEIKSKPELPLSILELVRRGQKHDEEALEQLIQSYQHRVAAIVRSLVHDDDWQDVCQQSFVKMVLGLSRLKEIDTFESWLFTIARNCCLDHFRRRRAKWFLVSWSSQHADAVAEAVDENESRAASLDAAVSQLPEDQRELVNLMRTGHWTYPQLSRTTGLTVANLKSRLFRARQRIRQLMKVE